MSVTIFYNKLFEQKLDVTFKSNQLGKKNWCYYNFPKGYSACLQRITGFCK